MEALIKLIDEQQVLINSVHSAASVFKNKTRAWRTLRLENGRKAKKTWDGVIKNHEQILKFGNQVPKDYQEKFKTGQAQFDAIMSAYEKDKDDERKMKEKEDAERIQKEIQGNGANGGGVVIQGAGGSGGSGVNQGAGGSGAIGVDQGTGGSGVSGATQGDGGSVGSGMNQGAGGSVGSGMNQGAGGSVGSGKDQGAGGSVGSGMNQGAGGSGGNTEENNWDQNGEDQRVQTEELQDSDATQHRQRDQLPLGSFLGSQQFPIAGTPPVNLQTNGRNLAISKQKQRILNQDPFSPINVQSPSLRQFQFQQNNSNEVIDLDHEVKQTENGPTVADNSRFNRQAAMQQISYQPNHAEHQDQHYHYTANLGNQDNQLISIISKLIDERPTNKKHSLRVSDNSLTKFSGEPEAYNGFKKQILTYMDGADATEAEKLRYLVSRIDGDAYRLLQHLPMCDENYATAWDIMDSIYYDPASIIINTHLKGQSLPVVVEGDSQGLKNLIAHYGLENAQMKTMGFGEEQVKLRVECWLKLDPKTQETVMNKLNAENRGKEVPLFSDMIPIMQNLANRRSQAVRFSKTPGIYPYYPLPVMTTQRSGQAQQAIRSRPQAVRVHATELKEVAGKQVKCFICEANHMLFDCPTFIAAKNKMELLKKHKICFYCARHKYSSDYRCKAYNSLKCDKCQGKHITILHENRVSKVKDSAAVHYTAIDAAQGPVQYLGQGNHPHPIQYVTQDGIPIIVQPQDAVSFYYTPIGEVQEEEKVSGGKRKVILPLADATITSENGSAILTTSILDAAAQGNLIKLDLAHHLGLEKIRCKGYIKGSSGSLTIADYKVIAYLQLPDGKKIKFEAFAVPKPAGFLPSIPKTIRAQLSDLKLADSSTSDPEVGVIFGATVLAQIMKDNVIRRHGLFLQDTELGFMAFGECVQENQKKNIEEQEDELEAAIHVTTTDYCEIVEAASEPALQQVLNHVFQGMEKPFEENSEEPEEVEYCEKIHREKHKRDENGRYREPIPWKIDAKELGDSYEDAKRHFFAIEKRLEANAKLREEHNKCFDSYIKLGHLREVPVEDHNAPPSRTCYIKYHPIIKEEKATTKYRVVFNASGPTSNGVSFNDTVLPGPKLQTSVPDVITRSRQFKYMFCADVSMMYRTVGLLEEEEDKIRVFHRSSPNEPLKEYSMTTVTFGVACAPYQAIRALHQLAEDNAPSDEIMEEIKEGSYVDDVMTGADTISEGQEKIKQITNTFAAGQMKLTKFHANDEELLKVVPVEDHLSVIKGPKAGQKFKALGHTYNAEEDSFEIQVAPPSKLIPTKRGLLSFTASIYDTLGWILPLVMFLRILIQKQWEKKATWDEKIDEAFDKLFRKVIEQLPCLNQIRIPRWLGCSVDDNIQLIGFADASMDGYCAIVYSRVKVKGDYIIRFISAKGHVTPLKTKANKENRNITIPKLELQALVLLAQLYKDILKNLKHHLITITSYTDSEVALAWMRGVKEHDNKFVRQRVAKAQKIINPAAIHYVKSEENPADVGSRGAMPSELASHTLWFNGPAWLKTENLPFTPFIETARCFATFEHEVNQPMDRFSSWSRGLRILTWVFRFHCYTKERDPNAPKGPLTKSELERTTLRVLKIQQEISFFREIQKLMSGKFLQKTHWMAKLAPFINSQGLIVVGGRLEHSQLPEHQKHPILLPKCNLAKLIIREVHEKNGHCDNTLCQALVQERFWLCGIKQQIKTIIHNCPTCIRWRREVQHPMMGNLPAARLQPAPIFSKVGVDLCGHFFVKTTHLKFAKTVKVWIAIFVCMVTKAVHIELCYDLSTEKFLEALTRFIGRRGVPQTIYSDNGSNFVGSDRQMQQTWNRVIKNGREKLAVQGIGWEFNPPHAPFAGGLWESAVKTFKFFLKRMNSGTVITIENFTTVICKIEGLMNSRPLCVLPSSPGEPEPLTPFHFIAQRSHQESAADYTRPEAGLARQKWLGNQKIIQAFWVRFNQEYLVSLQKRVKWVQPCEPLEVRDLVLIKEPNQQPGEWKRGLVTKIIPDKAGNVRKVEVKTAQRENVPRSVHNLIRLSKTIIEDVHIPRKSPTHGEYRQMTAARGRMSVGTHDKNLTQKKGKKNNHKNSLIKQVDVSDDPKPTKSKRKSSVNNQQQPTTSTGRTRRAPAHLNPATWILALTIVQCITSSSAMNIQAIPPGIHVRDLGQAYVKAFDLDFTVTTSVNVSKDSDDLDEHLGEYKNFCNQIGPAHVKLQEHCKQLQVNLEENIRMVKQGISNSYEHHRQARAFPLVTAGVKLLVKATPIIMTTGLIYTAVENERMKADIRALNQRINSVSTLLLNVTEIEVEAVDKELNKLVEQQNALLLELQTNEYAEIIQTLSSEVQTKHQNLDTLQPLKELQEYWQSVEDKFPAITLPLAMESEQIFYLNKPEKYLQKGMVSIKFRVPLIMKEKFHQVAFINIPSLDNFAVKIPIDKPVGKLIINGDNSSYSDISHMQTVGTLFANAHWKTVTPCMKDILVQEEKLHNCEFQPTLYAEGLYELRTNETIIVKKPNSTATVTCTGDQPKKIWLAISVISHEDCILELKNETISSLQPTEQVENYSMHALRQEQLLEGLETVTRDPRIAELSHQIDSVIHSSGLEIDKRSLTNYLVYSVTITIAILVIGGIIGVCMKRFCQRRRWTSRDELPHSWITDWFPQEVLETIIEMRTAPSNNI